MIPDLNPAEMSTVAQLLKDAIERDPFPLSPRVQQLRSMAKLEPTPVTARPEQYPAPHSQ